MLDRDSPNATFSLFLPCDLENNTERICIISVDPFNKPDEVPNRNALSAIVRIRECETAGEFCTVSG